MSHSIIAFSTFFNVTSTVLTLIITKILTNWEVTQYDPVDLHSVWRNVFLPSSIRKKIYTILHSVKSRKKAIFETYRVTEKLRHSSLCGTPEKLISVSSLKPQALGERVGVTLRHAYLQTDGLDEGVCLTNRKLRKVYQFT